MKRVECEIDDILPSTYLDFLWRPSVVSLLNALADKCLSERNLGIAFLGENYGRLTRQGSSQTLHS